MKCTYPLPEGQPHTVGFIDFPSLRVVATVSYEMHIPFTRQAAAHTGCIDMPFLRVAAAASHEMHIPFTRRVATHTEIFSLCPLSEWWLLLALKCTYPLPEGQPHTLQFTHMLFPRVVAVASHEMHIPFTRRAAAHTGFIHMPFLRVVAALHL